MCFIVRGHKMCILVNLHEYFNDNVFSSTSGQPFFSDLLAF